MEIRKYWCKNCKIEHIVKTYENKSEALMDVFMESAFPNIWDKLKEKQKEKPIEEFCKELVETSIYNFHKYKKKLKIPKGSIKQKCRVRASVYPTPHNKIWLSSGRFPLHRLYKKSDNLNLSVLKK